MADFAPPPGPPPPKVPEGWKAQFNDQYKEWFYVNIYTKKSQWDKPTSPVYPPSDDGAPSGPPPGYDHGSSINTTEKGGLGSNNPYGQGSNLTSDEALARKLQAEEEARAGGSTSRGANDSYYQNPGASYGQQPAYGQAQSYGQQQAYGQQQSYGSQELPPRDEGKSKGFLGKLLGKSSSSRPQGYGGGYPQQQQGYYGRPPPQQYYPQQQAAPQKSHGLGTMGGAALGLGGGLVGGMLLEDAIQDHDQSEYQQGYDQGQDNGDGGGGDYGGGDGGGGDFGGDDGGGDMGGGDF